MLRCNSAKREGLFKEFYKSEKTRTKHTSYNVSEKDKIKMECTQF